MHASWCALVPQLRSQRRNVGLQVHSPAALLLGDQRSLHCVLRCPTRSITRLRCLQDCARRSGHVLQCL